MKHAVTPLPISDVPASLPLYLQVEIDLKKRILSGELALGGDFPSASEICKTYGVSMITARRAMRNLAEKNYIVSYQGRGTVVSLALPEESAPAKSGSRDNPCLRIVARSPFVGLFTSTEFKRLLSGRFKGLDLEIIDGDSSEAYHTQASRADLFTVGDYDYRALRNSGRIIPLSELADASTLADIRSNLLPELPRILGEAADYMLPLTCSPIVLIYNRDLLLQGGVPPEFGLATIDEFVSTCRRLKEGLSAREVRGAVPLLFELNHCRRWPLAVYWNGGKVWREDGKGCLLESQEAQDAFAWYRSILVDEPLAVNSFTFCGRMEENLFLQGKLAFHFGSYTTLFNYEQHCRFDYDIARVPTGKKRATLAVQGSIAVSQHSEHKQLAFEFAKFLLTAPVQRLIHQRAHLPSSREALEQWSLKEADLKRRHHLSRLLEGMSDAVPLEFPISVRSSERLGDLMSQVWLDLTHAPEICREITKTLAQEISLNAEEVTLTP